METTGSLPVIMPFHLTSNVCFGGVFYPMFAGDDPARFHRVAIALTWLAVWLTHRVALDEKPENERGSVMPNRVT